ncbi:MAG TPA: hypothetical protein PLT04_04645 [Candidatus Saccharibacteria bacterium]|nr:hypothetical protein [Candidatus Saccharibacteria bacterium]
MADRVSRWIRWVSPLAVLAIALLGVGQASAQSISQAYGTDGNVQKGMIVMINAKNSKKVQPLSNKKDVSMLGVAVAANDTVVSLGMEASMAHVYVASTGKYETLVSTQNGPVKAGDLISISAIDGIGMKADNGQGTILGKAVSTFNGQQNVSGTMQLNTSAGKRDVAIGLAVVDISISRNPLAVSVSGPPIPSFLKKAGDSVSGKPVSTVRLYVSLAILLVVLFLSSNILYGGIRSSIQAVGRNPLAKKSIIRGLIQVVVTGLIVLVIGLFSVYLLLRL